MSEKYQESVNRIKQIGFILECYLDFIELQYMDNTFEWFDEIPLEYSEKDYVNRIFNYINELKSISKLIYDKYMEIDYHKEMYYKYLINISDKCLDFYYNILNGCKFDNNDNDKYIIYMHYLNVRKLIGTIKDFFDISWYDVSDDNIDQSDEEILIH